MPSYAIIVSEVYIPFVPYRGVVFSRQVSPPSREKLLSLIIQPWSSSGDTGSIEIASVTVDGQNILTPAPSAPAGVPARFYAAYHITHHINRLNILAGIEYQSSLEIQAVIHGPQGGYVTILGVVEMHSPIASTEYRFIRRVDDVNELWEVIHKNPEGEVLHRGIIVRASPPNRPERLLYKYSVRARVLGSSVWEHVTVLLSDSELTGPDIEELKQRYANRLGLRPGDIDVRLVEVVRE